MFFISIYGLHIMYICFTYVMHAPMSSGSLRPPKGLVSPDGGPVRLVLWLWWW